MGAIFEKYPEVQSITWDQWEDLGGYFHADPWSVLINGKSIGGEERPSEQEHAAEFEMEGLILQAFGEEPDSGVIDFTTPTAFHTGNLLRAIFGNNVIVTLNRDGSIEREPSWGRVCHEDRAELQEEQEAREAAFTAHISTCKECTATIDDEELEITGPLCETGRKMAQVLVDEDMWEVKPAVVPTTTAKPVAKANAAA